MLTLLLWVCCPGPAHGHAAVQKSHSAPLHIHGQGPGMGALLALETQVAPAPPGANALSAVALKPSVYLVPILTAGPHTVHREPRVAGLATGLEQSASIGTDLPFEDERAGVCFHLALGPQPALTHRGDHGQLVWFGTTRPAIAPHAHHPGAVEAVSAGR